MKFSAFGEKFAAESGISALMEDLGNALAENPDLLFMGGGNPGRIDAVQEVFAGRLRAILDDPAARHHLLGVYQAPRGERVFREQLARYLQSHCGWSVGPEHIAVTNGSQSAFFLLANMFAGADARGATGTLHLPLCPEYVGYKDVAVGSSFFTSCQPLIEHLDQGAFKYRIDRSQHLPETTRAVCLSRPSNPTGNVVDDEELQFLVALAGEAQVPLLIDGAYGLPFPGLVYGGERAHWDDNTILMLSLSKLGLPGVRTGIIVARPEIATAVSRANTVMSLASGTLGPAIVAPMLEDGSLDALCREQIVPFYAERRDLAISTLRGELGDLPVHLHSADGGFFLWLWCEGVPLDSNALYERLKARGVVVLPGSDFFIGAPDDWQHQHECLRLSYAGDAATIRDGCALVAEELRHAYTNNQGVNHA